MYSVLVAAMALHAGVHNLDNSSGIVDWLLPDEIDDTFWTVSCDGTFEVQYLNDFDGDFIIYNNVTEESRVSGEHRTVTTQSFVAQTRVILIARVKSMSGNKKVLFSYGCDAVPAALPSTLNTAGDVSHMKYGPNEGLIWHFQCDENEDVHITWTSFNIGNDSLWMVQRQNGVWSTFFNASGLDTAEDFIFASTGSTYVVFTSEVDSAGGDFAFRYECLSNDIVLPSSGIVDRLLPTKIADTVWTVSCHGTFVVNYLNDFGGDFIISIDGNEELRVSGEHTTLTTKNFAVHTTVTMTASMKTGNKKVLFSWACDAVPAALPSTLNTAGDVSHISRHKKYGSNEQEYWILQCKEHEDVNITWTSFNIGNNSLWIAETDNGVLSTFFNASGVDTAEDFTFTSTTGSTYVVFTSEVGSDGGDFAFRYECLSNDIVLPISGIVDRLLPTKIADTVWTVSCHGIFVVNYLNDFGGDFIISIDGNEESRVSGAYNRVTTHRFAVHTTVTMTASMKTGNKKVLFSWACDSTPAALPSTLNTAGDVSHIRRRKNGPSEQEYWILQCKEHEDVKITWTSFNIGSDSLWIAETENGVLSTFFNASGVDTAEDFTFTSTTGSTYVVFTSEVGSDGGDFAFRYECLSNDIVLPSSGIVDRLLPTKIADTVWTVSCHGTFVVNYLNDFGGDFIISIDGNEELRVSGEHTTLTTKNFAVHTTVTMTASMKTGNKKVLFSWACDAVPAALPSTLNTAGDVSHISRHKKYGSNEQEYWILQCKEHEDVNITWTSFNIGNNSLWIAETDNGVLSTFFNASGVDTAEDFTFTSTTGSTYVVFTSEADSAGGDFAFRYECLSNDIVLPISGIVDRLLPTKIADTVWTVSCHGIFVVNYLNDFGGDFIISIDGNEELRVSGEQQHRVTEQLFPVHTTVTMTASMKTGNKKVLFSWACGALPAALPSTLNTAGDVSHMKYGPNEQEYWEFQCEVDVHITWTSFNIGSDSLWMLQRENGVWSTFFNASGVDTAEDFTFTSTGSTYVVFTSEVDTDGGDFAFRYECLSTPAPVLPTAEPTAVPTATPTAVPTATPTAVPTAVPAGMTAAPTAEPTAPPAGTTAVPTAAPTALPVGMTAAPTAEPTAVPTAVPAGMTAAPTAEPTALPARTTAVPTATPTAEPTALPAGTTAVPTATPTAAPTALPAGTTAAPTASPTVSPTAAPTAAPTPVPTTEAPSSAAMTWCTTDAQCKQHGDTAATCKDNGHCTCGDGFVKPFDTASGRRAHICVTSETRVSDVVHATFDVACDGSSGKGARVGEFVVDLVGGTVTDVREECGSLNVFVSVSDMPLLDVAAMDVAARLSEKVQGSDLGLGDVLSAGLASVDAVQCPTVPGVSQVYRTDAGECVPLSCLGGYTRVRTGTVYACISSTAAPLEEDLAPTDSDDELAVGAIVGISVGVGLVAIAAVVLVVCCVSRKQTTKEPESPTQNAPNEHSNVSV